MYNRLKRTILLLLGLRVKAECTCASPGFKKHPICNSFKVYPFCYDCCHNYACHDKVDTRPTIAALTEEL